MTIDLLAPAFRADPYPHYAAWRDAAALLPTHGGWVVTRYDDVRAVLTDPGVSHWADAAAGGSSPFQRLLARWVRLMDPRAGSYLRAEAERLVGGPAAAARRPAIERAVDELLDRLPAGRADLVADVAEPLSLGVTADLIGVPPDERPAFFHWARGLSGRLVGLIGGAPADAGFADWLLRLVERKRREPGDDLLTALTEAARRGDDVGPEDYLAFVTIFLFAGSENSTNAIGTALLALVRRPGCWDGVGDLGPAVEELLRFDSAVQFVNLVARSPLTVGGTAVAPGETLLAAVGSANRDPRRFADPDRLDLSRSPNPHLTFGAGSFYCVGAALARVELAAVVSRLVGRFEPPRLTGAELRWRTAPAVLRGPGALPVELRPRSGGAAAWNAST